MNQDKQARAQSIGAKLFRVLGSDDSVNTCDCCGKKNLKATFAIEMIETGEQFFYGSVCVTRNTGRKTGELNKMRDAYELEKRQAAQKEYRATSQCTALNLRMRAGLDQGFLGRAFKEFCAVEQEAADIVRADIAARNGIDKLWVS